MSYLEPFMQTVLQISISTAAVIGFLLLLIPVWQQRYSALWRKVIWLVIAIRLLVPFSIELSSAPVQVQMDFQRIVTVHSQPVYTDDIPAVPEYTAAPSDLAVNNSSVTPSDMTAQNGIVWNQGMILSVIWIAGVLAFVLWHGVQYIMFHRKVFASAMPLEDGDWLLNSAGADMDLHYLPDVLISAEVQSPMLVGFKKPVIVLPERIYREQELLLILRHELMHYKHYDLWYKLVLLAANAVHWFNPLVYLMLRQAGRDVEQVCDDNVVAGQDMAYRKAYSLTILNTIANQKGVALSTCLSKDAQNVKKRFAGILQPKQYKRGAAVFLGIVLLAAAASGCMEITKPVEGAEILERVEAYLPEGLDFGERLEYKNYDSEVGIVHQWADYADKTPQNAVGINGETDEECWITLIIDMKDNIVTYDIQYVSGYHEREQLPDNQLSNAEAKQLAETFVSDISGEADLQFETWKPHIVNNYRLDALGVNEIGWIADSVETDYYYEVIVNTKYGHVQYYHRYFDNEQLRKQMTSWLYVEAMETFMPYPRLIGASLQHGMVQCWLDSNRYWMYAPLEVSYLGEMDARNPDSIWSKTAAPDYAKIQNCYLAIRASAPVTSDGNLDIDQCQIYIFDLDEDGTGFWSPINGFDVFIGKSQNALPASASLESSEMIKAAVNFANNLAALTNASDEAARNRIKNHPILKMLKLPDYTYQLESELLFESIHTDFFRRYGQFGNDGESYEPVVLSAEMEKEDGTTDTLTMWLITEDGKWKVADAELEPIVKSDESAFFWEYTGYLDAFPWENTEDSSLFSDDYDGDGKTDRVYRSAAQEEGYYQYQIEFASGEVLKLEKPVSNIGYPRIDGADVTGDGQNEIIFQVGYPASTNPLAFGELVVYEQQKGNYLPMQLPFEDGEEPYQNLLPVTYSKADGQAVKVSVPGTDFTQVVPIENDDLWNGYQYSSTYTRGETMQHSIWAYKIRNVDGKAQLICSIQLFDKWSEWGLDITLGYKNGRMIIDEIEFCEDIYAEWT
ncbi:MAG: M56 family metallopeptidase [Peptococcaceae bacterium]|nr:M56 family metallopeptidase [Peptococcaceae bacterium]